MTHMFTWLSQPRGWWGSCWLVFGLAVIGGCASDPWLLTPARPPVMSEAAEVEIVKEECGKACVHYLEAVENYFDYIDNLRGDR